MARNLKGWALAALGCLTWLQAHACALGWRLRAAPRIPVDLARVRRILVVRLEETIGDTVMGSAFLRELRAAAPNATIDLVVHDGRRDMYEHCPYVDRVVTTSLGSAADRRVVRRPVDARQLVRTQRLRGYDIAFSPRVDYDHHATFLVAASRSPIRVGFSERSSPRKAAVSRGSDRLLTHAPVATPHRHEVDRQLDLLRLCGHDAANTSTEVWLGDATRAAASDVVRAADIDGDFIVLAPTGGHSDLKQWPLDRYADLARTIAASGATAVFMGGPGDRSLVEALPEDVKLASVDLVGRTSPMTSAAVIELAAAFAGADSGMSHVAAALGVPTVAVFGPTCVHAFAPRGRASRVVVHELPCGPCARGANIDRCDRCIFPAPLCMSAVQAGEVNDALAALQSREHPASSGEGQN